jgi:hypothetical protein
MFELKNHTTKDSKKECEKSFETIKSKSDTKPMLEQLNAALSWTEADVDSWLADKNIHPVIRENVSPTNGEVLYQIFQMKTEIPEFFYNSITNSHSGMGNNKVPTKDVANFVCELKKIFKQ